jgi:vacuolar-type H+-ATPase subunit H
MTSDRIREIQEETAYPQSVSVMLALKKVWNECVQESYTKEQVENIANWAFGFHRRNDLSDSELEEEFDKLLNEKLNKKTEIIEEPKNVILGDKTSTVAQLLDKISPEPEEETLEDVVVKRINDNVLLELHHSTCYSFAELGAKFQQNKIDRFNAKMEKERTENREFLNSHPKEIKYTQEEVIKFGTFIFEHMLLTNVKGVTKLFEEFKNK